MLQIKDAMEIPGELAEDERYLEMKKRHMSERVSKIIAERVGFSQSPWFNEKVYYDPNGKLLKIEFLLMSPEAWAIFKSELKDFLTDELSLNERDLAAVGRIIKNLEEASI
jgi:hypothetical protein